MIWGDPEKAATMEQGSDLATILFQISSPAHIPFLDQRWQEFLHGYGVWAHMDDSNPLIEQACRSMTKHADMSSNLAALSLHTTRMLRDLARDIRVSKKGQPHNKPYGSEEQELVDNFSKRISRVAKARATAGALNIFRLLCHPLIVEASKDPNSSGNRLKEVFLYHTRGDLPTNQPAGLSLIHSLLDFIAVLGMETNTATSSTANTDPNADILLSSPELYDAGIFSFQLLLVLCGTQLYQPFHSSFENNPQTHYFLEEIFRQSDNDDEQIDNNNLPMFLSSSTRSIGSNSTRSLGNGSNSRSKRQHEQKRKHKFGSSKQRMWTPELILETLLEWQLHRPPAPKRSIAHYYYILAQAAVDTKGGEKPGQDGLYESYMIVQASSQSNSQSPRGTDTSPEQNSIRDGKHESGDGRTTTKRNSLIVDTTKGIITLSGSIIFLPFRLMNLVFGVFATNNKQGSKDIDRAAMMKKFANMQSSRTNSRTRDILWLSDSLLADLGCSLLLLLVSNNRKGKNRNEFRVLLKDLTDNRWDLENGELALPDLPNLESFRLETVGIDDKKRQSNQQQMSLTSSIGKRSLTLNFESLFISFGRTLHTEPGALLLYTILQSSPSFAESLAVRSDLDNLVMPLLRTLYFASRSNTFMAKDYANKRSSGMSTLDIRSCPFRTQSQLYVIMILLLLFSQDLSFGRDVFRRVVVVTVPWYMERRLKSINLGSVIILTMLRSLLFTLNRLRDVFLLNNCCAVLENLSPSMTDLHEYAAMRLVSVTIMVMKKHAKLVSRAGSSPKNDTNNQEEAGVEDEDNFSSPLVMHSEVIHTLLGMIKHGLSVKNIEGNVHLIYALIYHQVDLINLFKTKQNGKNIYPTKQTERIQSIVLKTSEMIHEEGARSAQKVLILLEHQMGELKAMVVAADHELTNKSPSKRKHNKNRNNSHYDDGDDDIATFSYEEEADPEVFFVPYVWDLIVSVVTASTMEWKKDDIQVFSLLDEVEVEEDGPQIPDFHDTLAAEYTSDAEDMV